MEPGSDYLVMASHLPLRRISSTVRFFRGEWAGRYRPDVHGNATTSGSTHPVLACGEASAAAV